MNSPPLDQKTQAITSPHRQSTAREIALEWKERFDRVGTHEHLRGTDSVRDPSDRSFGFVFALAFAIAALLPFLHERPIRWWALAVSAAFLAVSLLRASLLHPLNHLWMKLALLLNRIMTPVITGIIFFLVVTPMGVLLRWSGKDPLRLRPDPAAESYWLPRDPPGPAPESMARQF